MINEVVAVHLTCKEYGIPPHKYYFPYITNGHMTFAIDNTIWHLYSEYEAEIKKRAEQKKKALKKPLR